MEFSLEHKLMLGTGSSSFSPADKAERQQAAVVLYRFIMARDQLEAAAQAFQAPPIYPEYYQALTKAFTNGSYSASFEMDVQGRDLGSTSNYSELLYTDLSADGAVNGDNNRVDVSSNSTMQGEGDVVQNYSVIKAGGQFYFKENDTDGWFAKSEAQLTDGALPVVLLNSILPARQGFLRDLNHQTLVHDTQVINGTSYEHYQATFSEVQMGKMSIKSVGDFLGSGSEKLQEAYNQGFTINYDVYIDADGNTAGEVLKLAGTSHDQVSQLDAFTQVAVGIEYNDYGVSIPIAAPL